MNVLKKIAMTGAVAVAGIVLYRFARIVAEVVREEFPAKDAPKAD